MVLFSFTEKLNAVWINKGEANYSETIKILEDSNGDVLVAGNFLCALTTDTFAVAVNSCDSLENSVQNFFIAKYDSNGQAKWLYSSDIDTTLFSLSVTDFTIDASDQIYLTGWYDSVFVFGDDTLTTKGERDVFLIKLDTSGNLLWSLGNFATSDTSFIRPSAIAVKSDGNISLSGMYYNNITINTKQSIVENASMFMMLVNSDGSIEDAAFGTINAPGSKSSVVDMVYTSEDSLIVMALIQGDVSWSNSGSLVSAFPDTTNLVFLHLGNDTLISRLHQLPIKNANTFCTDPYMNLIIAGSYSDDIEFSSDTLISSGNQEGFIIKLDRTENYLWGRSTKSYGTSGLVDINALNSQENDDIYFGGLAGANSSGMNLVLDEDTFLNIPNKQAIFGRFAPTGELDWLQFWGNFGNDRISYIHVSGLNLVYVSGNFTDSITINNISAAIRVGYQNYFVATADLLPSFTPAIGTENGITEFCDGDSVMIFTDANPVYDYQWYKNGELLGDQYLQYASASGTYWADVTHTVYGYTKPTKEIHVTVNTLPDDSLKFTGDTVFCIGDSVVVSSFNKPDAFIHQWYENGFALPTDTSRIVVFNSNNYYMTVQDTATGCSNTSKIFNTTLLEYPDTILTIHDDLIFCQGDSVLISSPFNINYTYTWYKDGDTLANGTDTSYLVKSSGEYSLEITNRERCISPTDETTFTALPSPETTIHISGDTLLCAGDSLTLVANSSPGYYYKWYFNWTTPGSSSSNINYAKESGVYAVEVFNQTGCSALSDTLNINQNQSPDTTLLILGETTFCQGDSAVLSMLQSVMYTFRWYKNNLFQYEEHVGLFSAKSSGTYYGEVTNREGCKARSREILITTRTAPDASLNISNVDICNGDSVLLQGKKGSNTSFEWRYNDTNIGGESSNELYGKDQGKYTLVATNTLNNCMDSSLAIVNLIDFADLKITTSGNNEICERDSLQLKLPEDGNYTYQWLYENTKVQGAKTSELHAVNQGDYRVVVTNLNICTDTTPSFELTVLNNPIPNINQNNQILSTASYPAIQWLKNGEEIGGSTTQTILVEESGTYTVQVEHENKCTAISNALTICLPLPSFNNSENVLTASKGKSYQWFINGDSIPGATQQVHHAQLSGTYSVAITGENNCNMRSQEMQICIPYPQIELVDGYILKASTGESYQWYLNGNEISGADTRIIVPENPGIYSVYIVDYDGCSMKSEPYGYQVTSIEETIKTGIRVYPNPAHEKLFVYLDEIRLNTIVEIVDLSGKTIYQQSLSGNNTNTVNLESIKTGTYIVKIIQEDKPIFRKFILLN